MLLSVTAAILVPESLTLWGLNNVMTVDESSLGGSVYPLDIAGQDISSLNKALTLNKPDLEQT